MDRYPQVWTGVRRDAEYLDTSSAAEAFFGVLLLILKSLNFFLSLASLSGCGAAAATVVVVVVVSALVLLLLLLVFVVPSLLEKKLRRLLRGLLADMSVSFRLCPRLSLLRAPGAAGRGVTWYLLPHLVLLVLSSGSGVATRPCILSQPRETLTKC